MILDGKKIVSDMPLCNVLYNMKSDSVQQYPFYGIRGFQLYNHLGTTAYDDFKIFRITNGSLSADATVYASDLSGYIVNNMANKITNIPKGVTVGDFLENILPADKNVPYGSLKVISSDGEYYTHDSPITDGMILESVSPNTVTKKKYKLFTTYASDKFGEVVILNNGRRIDSNGIRAGTLVAESLADIQSAGKYESADVVLAFYSDDKTLDEVCIVKAEVTDDITKVVSKVVTLSSDDMRTVKAFVLDGLKPLAPIKPY